MKKDLVSFAVGFIFAIGLGIAGMTQPQKVIGFLDLRNWDPSLVFVMAGAVIVHSSLYRIVRNRKSPLLDSQWHVPTRNDLTPRLIIGSALFGIGWGLAGYCPGPGITAIGSGQINAVAFLIAMLTGMVFYSKIERHIPFSK